MQMEGIMQMMGMMGMHGNKQFFHNWHLLDLNDPYRTSTHLLFPTRQRSNDVCTDYFPAIAILELPPWYAEVVSDVEWKSDIRKFNEALMNWWRPGDNCRSASLLGAPLLLFPLICFWACDEQGQCCFTNRKKRQLIDVMRDICAQLTSSSRFEWIVEWRPEAMERANVSEYDVKSVQLRIKAKSPIGSYNAP
jgi:hypothetical protein